ncbi:MAG: HupE/UreJ family protein [Polyangiaceae bacterium]|nr:HupE/UreJ family protein [Polyangiaceae bacterium]
MCAWLWVFCCSGVASAHDQRAGYVRVVQAKGNALSLELSIPTTRLKARDKSISPQRYQRSLIADVTVMRGPWPCRVDPESFSEPRAEPGWYRLRVRLLCPGSGNYSLESQLGGPGSLLFARGEGPELVAVGFGTKRPLPWLTAQGKPPEPSLASWLFLGVRHIWAGADHLTFLVLLLLCSARLRDLAKTVTGFTLGHSLTLIAASRGWIHVETSIVETLIAFSILLLATELISVPLPSASSVNREQQLGALLKEPPALLLVFGLGLLVLVSAFAGYPATLSLGGAWLFSVCYLARRERAKGSGVWLSSAFGLIHGLGFAAALGEGVADPGDLSWRALFGFNLGVELGQILVMLPLWALVSRLRAQRPWIAVLSAAAATALATRWLFERLG